MMKIFNYITKKVTITYSKITTILKDKHGEGFVDNAIAILIAVVIGALLLAGLYALFGETVLPTLTERIKDMFDYNG